MIAGGSNFPDGCDVAISKMRQYEASPLNGCWNISYSVSCEGKRIGSAEVSVDFSFGDFLEDAESFLPTSQDVQSVASPSDEDFRIRSISPEQQVAEKLHSLARTYDIGETNPRTKDLFDIYFMLKTIELDEDKLAALLKEVSDHRRPVSMYDLPDELPKFPDSWELYFNKIARESGAEIEYETCARVVRTLYINLMISVKRSEKQ
jgi:hypothetical protein